MRKQLISMAFLSLLPIAAQAQESDGSGFNWNAAATSEYMFRGISQTDDHPALQVGGGYSFSSGFYVGGWASNVDFGRADQDTSAEIDVFGGWNGDVAENTNLDVQLIRYGYVGEPRGVNYAYNELVGKVTFAKQYTATLGYTNNYLNGGENSFYSAVGGTWEVGHDINLTAGLGYTSNSGPLDNYADYSVGVNRKFGPVNLGLSYVGTSSKANDIFGKDNAEDKFVFTVSAGG